MSREATEVANTMVRILRSLEGGFPFANDRRNLIAKLQPYLRTNLAPCREETGDWQVLADELAGEFEANPGLPITIFAAMKWPRPFALVLREELGEIAARRHPADRQPAFEAAIQTRGDAYVSAAREELFGVSFSGGGIRSATFNLGVLQYLVKIGLFRQIDFLSTVSGGGYIGAWIHAWNHRAKLPHVEQTLGREPWREPVSPDNKPLRFLRQFSNYLTPEKGFFSFDTWTMMAVYVRNVVLNQATLIAWIGALLLLPRFFALPLLQRTGQPGWESAWLLYVGLGFLAFSLLFVGLNLHYATRGICTPTKKTDFPKFAATDGVQSTCVLGIFLGAIFGSVWVWRNIGAAALQTISWHQPFWQGAALVFALFSLALSWGGGFWTCFKKRLEFNHWLWAIAVFVLITVVSVAAGLGLLRGYLALIGYFNNILPGGLWHDAIWGTPLLLLVLLAAGTLQIGLLGIDLQDSGREWLSRFRAVLNLYTFFWIALFAAAIYGPLLIFSVGKWAVAGGGLAWIASTAGALFAARSSRTGSKKDGTPIFSKLDILAKIGPPAFLAGFLLAISTVLQLLLAHGRIPGGYSFSNLQSRNWIILLPDPLWKGDDWFVAAAGTLLGILVLAGAILAWRVDINEFSMHHFYKNRLVRCYLGASNPDRKPNPFTGFDASDDLPLSELAPSKGYEGPYPIVNTTLNLSAGGQLAWQERKAASFIFTPRYSGFDLAPDSDHPGPKPKGQDIRPCAYRATEEYGGYKEGLRLGTVTAISGAAADPNQGYNTSPAIAFLMTVFDVRLGWWMGNPRRDKPSRLASPVFGLSALISELLGRTDDRTNFVSLSDGGHFDNMGLYELVRRRCTYIVVCDAEQDSAYKFGGLGMAIRKCRIDFGVDIDIDPGLIARQASTHRSDAHCAVGTVRYPDIDTLGTLVYIKASLTGDEPEDVLQFAASRTAFPHETTADQWFGESQFESYRKLGFHAACKSFDPASRWGVWRRETPVSGLFDALRNHWYPVNPNLHKHAIKHTATLNGLLTRIATTPALYPLGRALFRNSELPLSPAADEKSCALFRLWSRRSPGETAPADKIQEFYFAMNVLQLVEDLYFDFELDNPRWYRDPRIQGWRTLFETWKESKAVKSAWRAQRNTFRRDFQNFWDYTVNANGPRDEC